MEQGRYIRYIFKRYKHGGMNGHYYNYEAIFVGNRWLVEGEYIINPKIS